MMTVFHVIWSGGSGGAERFVKDIVSYSDKKQFRHIVCFLSAGGWVAERIQEEGVEVHILGMKSGGAVKEGWRMYWLIQSIRPDIIHNHVRNYIANLVLCCCVGIPRLYFEHGGEILSPAPQKEVTFYNLFGRFHNLVLANSICVRDSIIRQSKVPAAIVEVFYIGIDILKYAGRPSAAFKESLGIAAHKMVVGIVGRLVDVKGTDDFIRIAAEFQRLPDLVPCVFLIVGDGPRRKDWEQLAQSINADVLFLGDRADVPDILKICDVFLFTSRWEGFGMAILEAMSSSVPVMGFLTHGTVEIASKGGAISIADRSITKSAVELLSLLKDPERRNALGEAGRNNVRNNFEVRGSVGRLDAIYKRCLSGAHKK